MYVNRPRSEKTCLRGVRITNRQNTCAGPLLFAYWKVHVPYFDLFATSEIFNFLAGLCSWGDWFESRFVGNPSSEDRFCRDEAH